MTQTLEHKKWALQVIFDVFWFKMRYDWFIWFIIMLHDMVQLKGFSIFEHSFWLIMSGRIYIYIVLIFVRSVFPLIDFLKCFEVVDLNIIINIHHHPWEVAMLFLKHLTKDLHEFLMNLDHRPFLFLGYRIKVTKGEPNLSYHWGPNKICDEYGLTSYFQK